MRGRAARQCSRAAGCRSRPRATRGRIRGQLAASGSGDPAERVEQALPGRQRQGEELEHRRELARDPGEPCSRPSGEQLLRSQAVPRSSPAATSTTATAGFTDVVRPASARRAIETTAPPAAASSCRDRNAGEVEGRARLTQSLFDRRVAAEHSPEQAACARRRRERADRRCTEPGSTGRRSNESSGLGRHVEQVRGDPSSQPRRAESRQQRDERPEPEPEPDAGRDRRDDQLAHANHRRSSGSRPRAIISR